MRKNLVTKAPAEQVVKDIRRATRKLHSSEEKIRIVLSGLRGEDSIAELCRKEGIAQSLYYSWSKEFLDAGKRRLAGDTARAATSDEVKELRREAQALKEAVAAFGPDRVVIATHPDGRSVWLREDEVNEALGSRDLPVRHIVSSGIHDAQEPTFVPGAATAPA